ncbi:MAG: sugar-binding protein [Planctomycetota bacterium]|jgi:hypothetical protein
MSAKKWVFVGVLTLLISNLAMADPPATHPKTGEDLVIYCLRGTPEAIDGDLSDWNLAAMTPAVLDVAEQLNSGAASWTDVSDCGGEFYVLWDDEKIYIAAVVHDDRLSMNKSAADIWNADCIEMLFSLPVADSAHSWTSPTIHYQFGFNPNDQKWNWCNMDNPGQSEPDYLEVVSSETADGYICEVSIEYGQMTALDFSVGNIIGLHPVIDDTDDSDREIQMTWTGREAHDQSAGYGHMILSDERAIAKELARDPIPANEATDVPRDTDLSWSPGAYAVAHDVYVGTSFEDVNDGTTPVSEKQTETTYDPGTLDYGQTYYWRIDEVNGAPDNTVHKGTVWSFTVEPMGVPIENIVVTTNTTNDGISVPEKTIDGSGLNENDEHSTLAPDMWLGIPSGADPAYIQYDFDKVYKLHELLVWNYNVQFELVLGFGFKDVTVEYTENGTDWTALGDVQFAQATAKADYVANTTVALNGVAASGLRLTANSGYGPMGQFGLSEVRILAIPAEAREPQPADGATDVSVGAMLAWRAGRDAVTHEVYFGTDPEALELAGSPATPSYDPGPMDLDAVYYWRVDETSDMTWEGSLWSFATQEYLVVDDFESYDDEENRIYDTWLDGYVNDTGSTVGYFEAPFAEQTIVNSGSQSMPVFYDNAGAATSEADRDLGQDWSGNGIQSLTLFFYGDVANSAAQLYVKIDGTRIDYDGAAVNITRPSWQLWSIDLSQAGNVSNVGSLTIGIEDAGATGLLLIDDIRLYPTILEPTPPDITSVGDTVQGVPNDGVTTGGTDNGWPAAETPDLAIDDDTGTKFLHFKGETEPTGLQITPSLGATIVTEITFTTANDAPERDPASFELYGSNGTIDGPYTLIASGDIVDFIQADPWPRFTRNSTPITFDNDVAYTHYQVMFPAVRDPGSANSMQIAEVELLGTP